MPAVDSRVETARGEKVGYLRLAQFTKGSADALADAVEALREKGVTRSCSTCAATPAAS